MPERITATAATSVATKPEPGHDAWVVEDETFQGLGFESKKAETYATKVPPPSFSYADTSSYAAHGEQGSIT